MNKSNLKSSLLWLLCLSLTAVACRKHNVYTVRGTLLFSNTIRVPVTNYDLDLYQGGSPGIPIGISASSSSAHAKTDGQGNFSFQFTQGGASFLGIPASNDAPARLENSASSGLPILNSGYPSLDMVNFPYQNASNLNPLFLCKKVDTVIIQMNVTNQVLPTDSLTLDASNLQGRFRLVITGLSVPANSVVAIDTVLNGTFGRFDFKSNTYSQDFNLSATHRAAGFFQQDLAQYDEPKLILQCYLY